MRSVFFFNFCLTLCSKIETSPHDITYEDLGNGSKKLKFTRNSVVFGDTGYYGCSNGKADVKNKNYDDPNASWVYVYVRCKSSKILREQI